MDSVSRIRPNVTASQPEALPAEEKKQESSAGIAETPDHFEVSDAGSKSELFKQLSGDSSAPSSRIATNSDSGARTPDTIIAASDTPFAKTPDSVAPSGASAISLSGAALETLQQRLNMLKNEKSGLASQILDLEERLARLEFELSDALRGLRASGGKGGGMGKSPYDIFAEQKELRARLEQLGPMLVQVEAQIKQTMDEIDKLKSTGSGDPSVFQKSPG